MIKIFSSIRFFLIPYILIILVLGYVLTTYSKSDIHIFINQHNSAFADQFFKYITFLGDGIFVILVCLFLLFVKYRYALMTFSTYIITGLFVQVLKRFIFTGTPRPKLYFEGLYDLHLVEGVKIYTVNSFPSGHTASAFALFLCLAFIIKNRFLQFIFLGTACLTAFSRIYLSQHFLVDTYFGSLIGVTVVFTYLYTQKHFSKNWMEKSIYSLIKKA
jgi:membrane-associated phospholipid phosphatase